MHKVVKDFFDLQDNARAYHAGDAFPREGVEVSAERLAYLAGDGNRLGVPVIEEVKEKPKRTKKTEE